MTWLTEHDSETHTFAQRLGLQLLMLALCFYFIWSGISEWEFASGPARKFEGHPWLGRMFGVAEMLGGLALLDTEGAFVGALVLTLVMAVALLCCVIDGQTYAAFESLLMFNVCGVIATWRKTRFLSKE